MLRAGIASIDVKAIAVSVSALGSLSSLVPGNSKRGWSGGSEMGSKLASKKTAKPRAALKGLSADLELSADGHRPSSYPGRWPNSATP